MFSLHLTCLTGCGLPLLSIDTCKGLACHGITSGEDPHSGAVHEVVGVVSEGRTVRALVAISVFGLPYYLYTTN